MKETYIHIKQCLSPELCVKKKKYLLCGCYESKFVKRCFFVNLLRLTPLQAPT